MSLATLTVAALLWGVRMHGSLLAFLGSWALAMMKNAFLGISAGSVLLPVCVMLGLTALCTGLAVCFFRWE